MIEQYAAILKELRTRSGEILADLDKVKIYIQSKLTEPEDGDNKEYEEYEELMDQLKRDIERVYNMYINTDPAFNCKKIGRVYQF